MSTTPEETCAQLEAFAQDVVARALAAGATSAEVYARQGSESSIQVRDGAIEELHEGHPRSVGIRLWRDAQVASTYATDFRDEAVDRLIRDTLELATLTDAVPESALPDPAVVAREWPDLDLFDGQQASRTAVEKLELARATEAAALAADARVSRSGGAQYGDALMHRALVHSNGFAGSYADTYAHIAVEAICDDEEGKKRNGSWYTVGRHFEDLEAPEHVGQTAAHRAARQLGATAIPTAKLPVVFDPRTAASLIGLLFSVLKGGAVERGASYLLDRIEQAVASTHLTLLDDPLLPRGPASRPFDGEGLPATATTFIEHGVLKSFALNHYHARKLGRAPTGHASRPVSGAPGESHSNLIVVGGDTSADALIADIDYGFYCESMMGFGFNAATGDFSRGASGRLIERGELTRPVSEVTLSANFLDLFAALDGLADDVDRTRSVMCPTMRVAQMTLAGS